MSVTGCYGNCRYEFLPNVHNSITEQLKLGAVVLQQNHLTLINYIKNPITGMMLGDGVFTKLPRVKLVIQAHDCIPLLVLGDGFCGLVHISWRNLYLGIYKNMFKLFNKENINYKDLQFIIGPHIREESMEFTEDYSIWKNHEYYSPEAFSEINGKIYFNMERILTKILLHNGISCEQIICTHINTFTNDCYGSYRRNGINSSMTNMFTIETFKKD